MATGSNIRGTVVVITTCKLTAANWSELWPNDSESTRLRKLVEAGRVVLLGFKVFAEIEHHAVIDRVGGTGWGPAVISSEGNMAKEVAERAYEGRLHLNDLLGDLRMAGLEITRWDLFAAPFRLELDESVPVVVRRLICGAA